MFKFLFGVLIGIFLVAFGVYTFISRGGLVMSTQGGPLPLERLLAHTALNASIGKTASEQSPLQPDETNLLAGAHIYQQNGCVGCHGRLDEPPSAIGRRFYPHAPQLLPPGKGVTDDPVGATYWVVKNGIRFSAMPSFGEKLSENEVWQVSLLLQQADKLPVSVQDALRQQP